MILELQSPVTIEENSHSTKEDYLTFSRGLTINDELPPTSKDDDTKGMKLDLTEVEPTPV